MQKRKIEEDAIWGAYKRIMAKESLTAVATEIGLNRGTLRKYIETIVEPNLTENERNDFYQTINQNFRGNSTENKRENRNGIRKKAEEAIAQSKEIKQLAEYGVTPDLIEYLYKRLRQDKRTSYSKDTYIYKCLEHIEMFLEYGFSVEEVFNIFIKRPKLFTTSSNNIREILDKQVQSCGSKESAKQKFIEDPWIDLRKQKSEDRGER